MAEGRRLTEHYRLDSLVRSGEKGQFFRAVDLRSGQPVAVEMIREAAADQGGRERERFLATAAALRALDHPSLPRVLDYGFTAAGNAFLVTDPVSGAGLAELAGSPPGRVLSLLLRVLDGLEALGHQGIALPRLRAEGIVVTAGARGEEVKLLELGEAGLAAEAAPAPAASVRQDFALLACRLLAATVDAQGRVEVSPAVAGQLDDVDAVETLLASWLAPTDAEAKATFAELRRRLQFLLGGGLATRPAVPAVSQSEPPAVPVSVPAAPAGRFRLWLWGAGGVAALAAVAAAVFLLAGADRPAEVAPPPEPAASPSPSPSPSPLLPPPTPAPSPPGIAPTGLARAEEPLAAAETQRLAVALARGLAAASLPGLRDAVKLATAVPASQLSPAVKRNLQRAKDALAADARLTRAEKDGQARQILEAAADLLVLLPGSSRGVELRDRAASDLEAAADRAQAAGRLDEAAAALDAIHLVLPQRSGLAERRSRLDREKRSEQSLVSVLTEAGRLGEQNRPHEGLARLAAAAPTPRFRERFSRLEEKLTTQLAELDRGSPRIAVREGFEAVLDKDETVAVPLRITDDYGVKSVEAWVTAAKGQRQAVPVVHGAGDDYEATLAPSLHGNRDLELFVAATDHSGHRTQHGPTSLRRKRWYRPRE